MNAIMSEQIPDLPEYTADLETELAMGPLKCTAEEGVRRMEARIKGLTKELATLRRQVASDSDVADAQRIRRQLEDARVRLAGYRMQLKMKN
jgi:ribosomal protein L29